MLLNILHTIAITCAVGTNFYSGRQLIRKPQPNKANNTYNYNVNTNGNVQYQFYKNVDNDPIFQPTLWYDDTSNKKIEYEFNYENGTIDNIYTKIDWIIWDRTPKYYRNVNLTEPEPMNLLTYTNSANNEAVVDSKFKVSSVEIEVVGYERLIFLRYDPNGKLLDNTINIEYYLDSTIKNMQNLAIPQTQQEVFYKTLTTRSNNIENIFTKTTNTYEWSEYIHTNNLIDVMDNFIYDIGINSTVSYNVSQIQRDGGAYNIDITKELTIYDNEATYIMIYLQPRVVGTNTNSVVQANSNENSDVEGNYNYNNTYKGTLVIAPSSGTIEIVDIPGTMIYVLGMPFTFVSTAFNLTLFPNTAYEVNLSTLFLGILAVIIFVFLIKIVIKAFGSGGGN